LGLSVNMATLRAIEENSAPAADVGEVCGFITKRGKINVHSWRRRFFVLTGAKFWYYGGPSRDILLGGGVVHGVSRWPEKKHGLILTCQSGRKFQLICDSQGDCNKWWRAFIRAIDLSMECKDGARDRTHALRSKNGGAKKRPSDPASSAFLHLVDEAVGNNGVIEDDAENVSSSVNMPSSQPAMVLQKRKSLFANLPDGSEEPLKRNLQRGRAQSDQREVFKSQKVRLGDFRLVQTVGKGGFGKVLKVQLDSFHDDRGKVFAMKILRKQHVVETRQVNTTKTERRILQTIDHPFVVKLRYAFQSSTKLYMIMDYYSGGSLYYHIERNGFFSEDCVRFFAAEMTLALDHLHEHGIIYRDLKLENVLLDGVGHVALTDFGLSKDQCDETHLASTFCGTPVYVAPELIGKTPYGFSIDWWALGVVLFELLSGRVPFASRDRRRMFDKIVHEPVSFCRLFSAAAQDIIGDLLVKDPDYRLGCESIGNGGKDVQQHAFFTQYGYIDFGRVYRKEIVPPFTPPAYVCESNVHGIAARDTNEVCQEDICNFDNFTLLGESSSETHAGDV